jgi:hypothetical protein
LDLVGWSAVEQQRVGPTQRVSQHHLSGALLPAAWLPSASSRRHRHPSAWLPPTRGDAPGANPPRPRDALVGGRGHDGGRRDWRNPR